MHHNYLSQTTNFEADLHTTFSSPFCTGEDSDRYGHQRMFGSLGWGLAMFFVGIALDHSTSFPDHPCGPDEREKNYTICFATFSVLMGAALITATQINFKYEEQPEQEEVCFLFSVS